MKKLLSFLVAFVLVFSCFAVIPMTASAAGVSYVAKLNYKNKDSWTYMLIETPLPTGTYQFDVDYATTGSVTATVRIPRAHTEISRTDSGSHVTVRFSWVYDGSTAFQLQLRDEDFTGAGIVYFANPALRAVQNGVLTGNNQVWDFSKQYTDTGATITKNWAWRGEWYRDNTSSSSVFTVEKDDGKFDQKIYLANLNYTGTGSWSFLLTEVSLAAGTYQFDVDYVVEGSMVAMVKISEANQSVTATEKSGHITIPFTWSGGTTRIFLRDTDNNGRTGNIYFANPVLKKVTDGKVTGDNLVYDFYEQIDKVGATVTKTGYDNYGEWYKYNSSSDLVVTMEPDFNGWFTEDKEYYAKLNYTSGDTWDFMLAEPTIPAGTYQFDVDYISDADLTARVRLPDAAVDVTATEKSGHINFQFSWSGGVCQIQLRDKDTYGHVGVVYFANPVLKKVENGVVTGKNLVFDFVKQMAFGGNTLINEWAGYGRWYKYNNNKASIITIEEDTDGLFSFGFTGHSLVLAETIGVNFLMNLSFLTSAERTSSYMTFTIANQQSEQRVDFADAFASGKKHGFTCYISSVQMAESITPVFHYGDGETITGDAFSAKDYIDYVAANSSSFNSKIVTLVKALGDYGHYAQIYLGGNNNWVAGKDYTALARYRASDYGSADYTSRSGELSSYSMSKSIAGSAVTRVQYNLNFDSKTYVNVKLTLSAGESVTASANVNGVTIRAGGNGVFRTQGLPILQLGDAFTLSGTGSGNKTAFSVTLSGLSYIRAILNSGSASTAAKNTMAALYDYYKAAVAFAA